MEQLYLFRYHQDSFEGSRNIRVLIACEFSGRVREAFRKRGFDAWSCDLIPSEDGSPFHIQTDVRNVLDRGWDLLIAHPPCTYLCLSGVSWLYRKKGRWEKLKEAASFFRELLNAPVSHIAVENPIPHSYALRLIGRRYDQIIQPWMFGEPYQKATCLWLKNLPPLISKTTRKPPQTIQQVFLMPPSPDRSRERSKTYPLVAEAMAEQWGGFILSKKGKIKK